MRRGLASFEHGVVAGVASPCVEAVVQALFVGLEAAEACNGERWRFNSTAPGTRWSHALKSLVVWLVLGAGDACPAHVRKPGTGADAVETWRHSGSEGGVALKL